MAAVVVQEWYGGDSPHLAIELQKVTISLLKTAMVNRQDW